MKWTDQAEQAISRVPFFVRRRVRKRVEEEAAGRGAGEVRLEHVQSCQKKFLENMESEVRGFQVESCFGPGGCPNRAVDDEGMVQSVEEILRAKKLKEFMKEKVDGPLKMHHEFRVSVSSCPNSCSRPQIVDIGLIGARKPVVSKEPCSGCGSCAEACGEEAVTVSDDGEGPAIDRKKCLSCGKCIEACPTGTLREGKRGYRILVGGKLGRRPQLGKELPGIHTPEEALKVVERCVDHYKEHNRKGERFGEVLNHKEFHSEQE